MIETLFVIRHGQTQWNVASRMQGRLDSALTEEGRRQAAVHGRTLAKLGGVDALIASPLGRTRVTADLLRAHLDVAARYEPALMERDCGAWSGLTLARIEAEYPEEWRARTLDPYHHRPPQGESLVDMEARVEGLLAALLSGAERRLALVTHGVMSRVILKLLLGLEPAAAVQVRHPNEVLYRLDIIDGRCTGAAHFIAGRGPQRGLLHHRGDETIGQDHHSEGESA
ncbi:MAG: histidine phosphatase family protein [Pseudomonadales bacterium]